MSWRKLLHLATLVLILGLAGNWQAMCRADWPDNVGLLFGSQGIEPGDPSQGEAPPGKTNWYVDADAPDGGNGTYANPYNSFEQVVGYLDGSTYHQGQIQGGDYLYLKGTFSASDHVAGSNNMDILIYRASQAGTASEPTVIKSWLGSPRAVFDGEYLKDDLIHLSSNTGPGGHFIIQNIEARRGANRSVYIGHNLASCEVISVVIRDTHGNGVMGIAGGILFCLNVGEPHFVMRNSLVYNNDVNPEGVAGNRGGLSILSEPTVQTGAYIDVYENEIYDECVAVRHKHSGNMICNVYHNIIHDSSIGVWARGYNGNYIHHNIMYNLSEGVHHEQDNQQADSYTELYNCTLYNVKKLWKIGIGPVPNNYRRDFNIHDNIYYNNIDYGGGEDWVIELGRWSGSEYPIEQWESSYNTWYYLPSRTTFLFAVPNSYTFSEAGVYLDDSTMFTFDPQFVDAANHDFHLQPTSPAIGAGSTGGDLGALGTGVPQPPGQASNPGPANSATDVSVDADLSWTAGSGSTSSDVYFGTDSTPDAGEFQGNQTATTYEPGTMANNTTYYWRIDEVNAQGTTTGNVWNFTTEAALSPPGQASNPSPADSATDVSTTADLSWTGGSGATSSDVYFGTSSPGTFQGNQTATTYDPGAMANDTTYYWRIDEVNAAGTTTGIVWSFTTEAAGGPDAFLQDSGADGIVSMEAENYDLYTQQGSHDWISVTTPSGYTGTAAMNTTPNTGANQNTDYAANSPRLDFQVNFVKTGTHYVWIRGYGASGTDDSIHAGLDGAEISTCDRISTFSTSYTWSKATMDGPDATFNVASTGVHTVNAWMREDGFVFDKIVLTTNAGYTPTGSGPAESPRGGGSAPGQASNPSPADSATDVSITADLSWTAGADATSHDVYFGTSSPGAFQGNQTATTYDTGTMANDTTYYWRIDEVNTAGTTTGNVWSFTTIVAAPSQASNPSPADSATDVSNTAILSWTAGSSATSRDVYFGTSSPGDFQGNQTDTTFDPGTLSYDITYYWRIDEVNAGGTTTGTVWNFTTEAQPQPPGQATNPDPADSAADVSVDTDLSWTAGTGSTSSDVYFGTTSPGAFQGNQTATTFDTGTMDYDTTYYWRIDEVNANGTTTGNVWSFTTIVAGAPVTVEFGDAVDTNYPGTIEDTYTNVGEGGSVNYSTIVTLNTYTWPADTIANTTIIKWDLSAIPTDATVTQATLYLYQVVTGGDNSYDIGVHKIINVNPVINALTWNTYDGTNSWTGGADGGQSDIAAAEDTQSVNSTNNEYKTWTVTNMVADWVSTPASNYGMLVNSDPVASVDSYRTFASTDDSDTSIRPKLIVTYSTGAAPPGQASNPTPADSAADVSITADLTWTPGTGSTSSDVYFGTASPGTFQGNQTATTFDTGTMTNDTTYYWRIDEVNAAGTTTGTVWSFTTIVAAPAQASNPSPADSAANVSINEDLSWTAGSGATSHDVYFGTSSPGTFQGNQAAATFGTGTMANDTTYYWRIDEVNAAGTTTGTVWNFTTIVAVPGQASTPSPGNGATDVDINANLSWTAGSGAASHDVYFGTSSPGSYQGNQTATTFDPGTMANDTTYYWRIDEVNAGGTTTGSVWSFTTEAAPIPPPGQASNPSPADSAANVAVNTDLSWTAGSDTTSHDVYFGTSSPGSYQGNQTATTFDTGSMANDTTYYWRIDEVGLGGTTTGNVWSFTTIVAVPGQASNPSPGNGATDVSIDSDLSWSAGSGTTSHDVYFGTSSPGAYQGNQTATTFDTGSMANDTTYYWRIDEINAAGTTTGSVWSFTTIVAAPGQASSPSPSNGATDVSISADLSWTAGSGATSRDVYFGTTSPGTFQGNQTATTFDPGTMANDTTYYWRIDEINAAGTTTGSVWSFTTIISTGDQIIGWWQLDEGSGSTAADSSAYANDGTIFGNTAWTDDTERGWCLVFPGNTTDYVTIPNESDYDLTGNMTVMAWMKASYVDWRNFSTIIAKGRDGQGGWALHKASRANAMSFWVDVTGMPWDGIKAGVGVFDGQWHHVAGVYDGSNAYIYIDGGLDSNSVPCSGSISTNDWDVYIGLSSVGIDRSWEDLVDDVRVYNYALTQSEINEIYTGGPTPPGQASNPGPADSATDVAVDADLSWTAGSGATSRDVYFGTSSPGAFQGNQTATTFDPGTMSNDTTYYWRIDEVNTEGTTTGNVWNFTTIVAAPGQASGPSPANSATDVSVDANLNWTAGSDATSRDVYFGTTSPGSFQGNQTATTFDPGTMANDTTYYWRIDEINAAGTTTGIVWSFTTISSEVIEEFGDAVNTDHPGTVQDTYTNVGEGGSVNYSTEVTLNTYTWPKDTVANTTIIKWDLSSIPTSATVTDATLYLYQVEYRGNPYDIGVHKIINVNPVISACTWNTYDGTYSWTGGADGGQSDIAAAEDTQAVNDTNNEYKTWSVTNMVQAWVSTPSNNFGMLVNSDPVSKKDYYRSFASTDDTDSSIRPKLIVTYSD